VIRNTKLGLKFALDPDATGCVLCKGRAILWTLDVNFGLRGLG